MSRLRRPFLYDRYIFVIVKLLTSRDTLEEGDFRRLAVPIAPMRAKHGFLLTAWVFLPDHWHVILYPPYPLTISVALSAVKVSFMITIDRGRQEAGEVWQGRVFDHALPTVKDYMGTVEYIHLNPVRRGLVKRPEEWEWSSFHEYAGVDVAQQERRCGLKIERVQLPAAGNARI